MSHNNHIADRVVQIAARRLDDRDPEVASMAGGDHEVVAEPPSARECHGVRIARLSRRSGASTSLRRPGAPFAGTHGRSDRHDPR